MYWLPCGMQELGGIPLSTAISGDRNPEVFQIRNKEINLGALCQPLKDFLRYVELDAHDLKKGRHPVMIKITERRREYPECDQTDQWANACLTKKKTRLNKPSTS